MAEFRAALEDLGHTAVQTLMNTGNAVFSYASRSPAKLAMLQSGERLVVAEHAACLHGAGGLLESRAGEAVLVQAGRSITTRNWGTTLKLAPLLGGSAA
ncbi:MAG: DUF1697 domain-containing protein [Burkholderiaceae bacterium]|nr:DUF1697 domain-containing protein [Burkholderiaceae bacterium]